MKYVPVFISMHISILCRQDILIWLIEKHFEFIYRMAEIAFLWLNNVIFDGHNDAALCRSHGVSPCEPVWGNIFYKFYLYPQNITNSIN